MKNLKKSTDFEIYRMRDLIRMFNFTRFSSERTKKMERQIKSEFNKRNIIAPFSWDFMV